MNDEQIKLLLAAFYDGTASDEQLRSLDAFFCSDRPLSARWQTEGACYRAITEASRVSLPAGLQARLEGCIDSWSQKQKKTYARWLWGAAATAAVALLCLGIYRYDSRRTVLSPPADTYTDAREAARVAQETLVFVSEKLNSGIDRVAYAGQRIGKVNEILNKHPNKRSK